MSVHGCWDAGLYVPVTVSPDAHYLYPLATGVPLVWVAGVWTVCLCAFNYPPPLQVAGVSRGCGGRVQAGMKPHGLVLAGLSVCGRWFLTPFLAWGLCFGPSCATCYPKSKAVTLHPLGQCLVGHHFNLFACFRYCRTSALLCWSGQWGQTGQNRLEGMQVTAAILLQGTCPCPPTSCDFVFWMCGGRLAVLGVDSTVLHNGGSVCPFGAGYRVSGFFFIFFIYILIV